MDVDQFVKSYTRSTQPGETITREIPTRAPSVASDVAVPFLVALASALIVFLSVGMIALAAHWPVAVPLIPAGLIMALVWFLHLFKMENRHLVLNWDRLVWAFEERTNIDVNRDGFTGEPSEPWRIILEKVDGGELWLNFPTEELREKAKLAAAFVLNGTPFSEQALTGTNRPLTRSEFYNLRDLFMFHGLAVWKDPEHHTLGIRWTGPGRSMLRKLAELSTTPTRIPTPRPPEVLPVRGEWGSEGE